MHNSPLSVTARAGGSSSAQYCTSMAFGLPCVHPACKKCYRPADRRTFPCSAGLVKGPKVSPTMGESLLRVALALPRQWVPFELGSLWESSCNNRRTRKPLLYLSIADPITSCPVGSLLPEK